MVTAIRKILVVTACAVVMVAATASASTATTVRGSGTRWRPVSTSIARGGFIRWKAVLGNHVVKSYGSNWSYQRRIDQGEVTPRRAFNRRGTFRFFCTIHGNVTGGTCTGMCGKIVVG
jgi:plastocyanin